VIQFNPRSAGLRVRELRRALAYAIDRDKVLRETVLRDPKVQHGRITNGPFPSSSPANSVDVEPHDYDLTSALAMVLAAGRQMDNQLPVLKMIVPRGPVERAVAGSLAGNWKRIGVEVQIIDQPPGEGAPPVEWDLHYRTLQMLEPTVELWPFLAAANRAQISDLSTFPDWLKQQLVSVDRTSDWALALDATRRLHEVLTSDVRFIPLWEVDGYLVVRKNIQGFPESPLHCYQHIDNWTVNAWYHSE
jgi:ABC-type transport system substrate-binding protein